MSSTEKSDEEKIARRKARDAICQACPNAVAGNKRKYICGLCGCVIAAKIMLPGAKCPAGKW